MPSPYHDNMRSRAPADRNTGPGAASDSTAQDPFANQRNLVISTMKDEGPYLLEWVAWYRAIGFTDILVYTNDCTDGTDLMLQRLEQLGVLKHEYNHVLRRGPHKSALKHAMAHPLYSAADWAFVGDVDEFLNIHVGTGHINDLKAAHPDADVIPVVWRLFSSNGETEIRDALVTKIMTDAAPLPDGEKTKKVGFIKTFFRVNENVDRLGLHRPFFRDGANEKWSLKPQSDEDPLRLIGDLGLDVAQVNHYAVRSAKSFIIKRDRGRANHTTNRISADYWARWNAGGAPDGSILRNQSAHQAEYKRLLADPMLAAMHKAAIQLHSQRAEEILKNDAEAQEIYDTITAATSATKPVKATAPKGADKIPATKGPALVATPTVVQALAQPAPKKDRPPKAKQAAAPAPEPAPKPKPIPLEQIIAPLTDDLPPQGLASPEEAEQIIQSILAENDRNQRAPKRRKLRQTMLDQELPKGGRAAEIGVWQGTFSAEILNITRPRELVLIDPWDLLTEKTEEHTHSQHAQANQMRAKYIQVAGTLGRLPNCVVRKGFSAEVLESYPDHYFDWVYIDGNHMYDFVLKDILISARKVRPGGVIAGDDLFWKKDERQHVLEAVRDAMAQLGDRATQTRRGAQFIIRLAE